MGDKRLLNIDILKTIAILMVISLHSFLWNTNIDGSISHYIQYSLRLVMEGVPIFVFVNGFLVLGKEFNLKKHIKKIIKIFLILIIWSFILSIINCLIYNESINIFKIISYVINTKLGSKYTSVLWFLQKLIILYLFVPIIKKIYDTDYKLYLYMFLLILLLTYIPNMINLLFDIISLKFNLISKFESINSFINQFTIFLGDNTFFVYFMLGGIVKKNKEIFNNKKMVILGLLSYALTIIIPVMYYKVSGLTYKNNYIYNEPTLLIIILALYYIASKINIKNIFARKIINNISDNSMGIYLIHTLVINLINSCFVISNKIFLIRAAITLLVFIISWVLTIIIRKIPKLSYIVKL